MLSITHAQSQHPVLRFHVTQLDEIDASALVETSSGVLRGTVRGGVRVLRGVPFAAPPLGERRFAPPVRVDRSANVLNVESDAEPSLQAALTDEGAPLKDETVGSEDCLYLNVFAPAEPGPHPVLVWIHGGAGITGSPFDCDGEALARSGIVVIAIAYRLGLLGLLSVAGVFDEEASSNFALLDQIEALRWIQDNASALGGDANRVTVIGGSNGARSVAGLLAAPAARGLFQQAVVMSATGGGRLLSTEDEALNLRLRVLEALGLTPDEARQLRRLDVAELMRVQTEMWLASPRLIPFYPVLDGSVLPKRPIDAIIDGEAREIPILVGTTHDECDGYALDANRAFKAFEAPISMVLDGDAFAHMQRVYRDLLPAQATDQDVLVRTLTASEYFIPAVRLAEAQARAGGRVWMYRFDARLSPVGKRPGAIHGVDCLAVCDFAERFAEAYPDESTDVGRVTGAATELRSALVSFVHSGKPDSSQWPQYELVARATRIFDAESRLALDPDGAEREAWSGIL